MRSVSTNSIASFCKLVCVFGTGVLACDVCECWEAEACEVAEAVEWCEC